MKVVVNSDWGGFGVSDAVCKWLIKNKGWRTTGYNSEGNYEDDTAEIWTDKEHYNLTDDGDKMRSNPELIEAIEAVGIKKAGFCTTLEIIEIPDGTNYVIDDYDGMESIHETHRSWG